MAAMLQTCYVERRFPLVANAFVDHQGSEEERPFGRFLKRSHSFHGFIPHDLSDFKPEFVNLPKGKSQQAIDKLGLGNGVKDNQAEASLPCLLGRSQLISQEAKVPKQGNAKPRLRNQRISKEGKEPQQATQKLGPPNGANDNELQSLQQQKSIKNEAAYSTAPISMSPPQLQGKMLMRGLQLHLERLRMSSGLDVQSCFQAPAEPGVQFQEYLARFIMYCDCSPACYVLALVYIDRIVQYSKGITFNRLTSHRLLMAAFTLAIKFHDDEVFGDEYYAAVGGVHVKELNTLQMAFLKQIDWSLVVDPEVYTRYICALLHVAQRAA